MSEKEKRIAESIAKLPDPLKDRFLDKIEGAAMAMDLLGASPLKSVPGKIDGATMAMEVLVASIQKEPKGAPEHEP